jgi:hypothetical protein
VKIIGIHAQIGSLDDTLIRERDKNPIVSLPKPVKILSRISTRERLESRKVVKFLGRDVDNLRDCIDQRGLPGVELNDDILFFLLRESEFIIEDDWVA